MRRNEIGNDLKDASFEYFYWFSRFEFALKENGFLKNNNPGSKAEPSWEGFKNQFNGRYTHTDEANRLIELHPKRQFVTAHQELDWRPVGIEHCTNDLCIIVTMLITVRNNLFHGGKHGDTDVDSIERNIELLQNSKIVLDQLARLANFNEDYTRYY